MVLSLLPEIRYLLSYVNFNANTSYLCPVSVDNNYEIYKIIIIKK